MIKARELLTAIISTCIFINSYANILREPRPLKVGDVVPEELWKMPLKLQRSDEERPKIIKLDDFRGSFLILDFWATWCSSCIASIPKMHLLERELKPAVKLVSFTQENANIIRKFIEKNEKLKNLEGGFSSIVEEGLTNYFPRQTIPHLVIINPDGIISSITIPKALTLQNLSALIVTGINTAIPQKSERHLQDKLLDSNLPHSGAKKDVSYSAFTPYIDGLAAVSGYEVDSVNNKTRFFFGNRSVLELYSYTRVFPSGIALFINRRIWRVPAPNKMAHHVDQEGNSTAFDIKWARANTFCYEAYSTMKYNEDKMRTKLKYDLDFFFGLNSKIEACKVTCLSLQRTDKFHKSIENGEQRQLVINEIATHRLVDREKHVGRSKSGAKNYLKNYTLDEFLYLLNDGNKALFGFLPPVLNDTGYAGETSLNIDLPDKLDDFDALNVALKKQGLFLELEEKIIDMLVFSQEGVDLKNDEYILTSVGYVPAKSANNIKTTSFKLNLR